MKTGSVYIITCLANNKNYVGSPQRINGRFDRHLKDLKAGTHHNIHLQRAWDKYGADAFEFKIVEPDVDANFLLAREQFWIWRLESDDYKKGYNIQKRPGSSAGMKRSPEVCAKLAENWRGRNHTEESKQKMSEAAQQRPPEYYDKVKAANIGKPKPKHVIEKLNSPKVQKKVSETKKRMFKEDPEYRAMMLDKAAKARAARGPVSEETRAKMSKAQTGRKHTPETFDKMYAAQRNRSKEWRENIAKAKRGKKRSPETIEKMRQGALRAAARRRAEKKAKAKQEPKQDEFDF